MIPKYRYTNLSQKTFKRIAYFIGGGIGDAIMAYPSLNLITKLWPGAELKIFLSHRKEKIVTALFSNYCVLPFNSILLFFIKYRILNSGFDISFTNITSVFKFKIELASFLTSKLTLGFTYPDEKSNCRLYSHSIEFSEHKHFSEQNLMLISRFFLNKKNITTPRLEATFPDFDSEKMFIVIHPGSEKGYTKKIWPIDNYKEIITKLVELNYNVVVLLGDTDIHLLSYFDHMKGVDISINPAPDDLIKLIKGARLFLGNDSGPSHIASFFGIPGITLFGPVSPVSSAPIVECNSVIYAKPDCSPCYFINVHCQDNRCMKLISVKRVWDEIEKKINIK
jgi:ADP-heptose:LPS heptosyltransferase